MTALAANGGALLAFMRRDLRVALSYRFQLLSLVAGRFLTMMLFYYISRLVHVSIFRSSDEYFAFVVIGLILLQVLTSAMAEPVAMLRQELVAGTFERVVLSPFGAVGGVLAMMCFPLMLTIGTGIVMVLFGVVVFGISLHASTAALALPAIALGTLAFAPFGIVMVGLGLITKQITVGVSWAIAAITVIAGLYFPTGLLPGWIRWASDVQPFTPAVDLIRHVLIDTPLREAAWVELTKLAGFALVLTPVACWFLRRAIDFSRRRGTIIEY